MSSPIRGTPNNPSPLISKQPESQFMPTPENPENDAQRGKEILNLLSSPNPQESTTQQKTDIEILNKLAKQLEPTFEYLDLLVQNINHYINQKKAQKKPVEELLQGAVKIEKFFKKKLLDASKEITNPLITNLLQLTAHDVNLFANFGIISTIFNNPKTTKKRQVCQSTWNGTSKSQGIQANLREQKKLISSFFERIEKISEGKIGLYQAVSHKDFLKNLGKLFDQVQRDNSRLSKTLLANRLTLNNQAITPAEGNTKNPFDKTFTAEDFPIKFDPLLFNTILRNIINNALANSPPDSKLNLEINIIQETKKNSKPYLHIKLSNPLVDPRSFAEKNILENLKSGNQISTKKDPTETNGTFLKTLKSLMEQNGGVLKISTSTKDQNLENPEIKKLEFNLELKYPLEKSSGI
jgi:signal transduction histidine kinase